MEILLPLSMWFGSAFAAYLIPQLILREPQKRFNRTGLIRIQRIWWQPKVGDTLPIRSNQRLTFRLVYDELLRIDETLLQIEISEKKQNPKDSEDSTVGLALFFAGLAGFLMFFVIFDQGGSFFGPAATSLMTLVGWIVCITIIYRYERRQMWTRILHSYGNKLSAELYAYSMKRDFDVNEVFQVLLPSLESHQYLFNRSGKRIYSLSSTRHKANAGEEQNAGDFQRYPVPFGKIPKPPKEATYYVNIFNDDHWKDGDPIWQTRPNTLKRAINFSSDAWD